MKVDRAGHNRAVIGIAASRYRFASQWPTAVAAAGALWIWSVSAAGSDRTLLPEVAQLRDGSSGADWAGYGGTFGEQHSPLREVSARNVGRLGLAWSMDLDSGNPVTAPLAVGGTLYFVTGYSVVHAVDAATGRLLWLYDPKAPEAAGKKLRQGWGSRGLAWGDGKIYVGTHDGRLIALDAAHGTPRWSAMTVTKDDARYITGAPRVVGGKVLIGFGGADVGPTRGYVSAYDADTGHLAWRWFTVPGNPGDGFENDAMAMAAGTWYGEWWRYGGGGTVWNAMSYDPQTGTLFLGIGNGSPWNHKARSAGRGDNLFLCSIVALDLKTGRYKWHYQINPGESWDYNAAMDMALAEISINGHSRKVLLTAPKNGFFYVIDRTTGKLVSAEPFAKVNWASEIDVSTGRPIETPAARYPNGTTFVMWPGPIGAHSWHPMAFSRETGLAYIPVIEMAASWTDAGLNGEEWRRSSPLMTAQAAAAVDLFPPTDDPLNGTSRLVAWDPLNQKPVWTAATPGPMGGGVMTTAGNLVFQGQLDGQFNAYAADSGRLLWSFSAQAPVLAPPISYRVKGRQYVTVLTGMGTSAGLLGEALAPFHIDYRTQARRVLTFVLNGHSILPPTHLVPPAPVGDPDYAVELTDEELADMRQYIRERANAWRSASQAVP
jgi:quinohemoprotein ethanol dehydrogenase